MYKVVGEVGECSSENNLLGGDCRRETRRNSFYILIHLLHIAIQAFTGGIAEEDRFRVNLHSAIYRYLSRQILN